MSTNKTDTYNYRKINLVGQSLKEQFEELEKLILVAQSGIDIQIETDQENLISIAPLKAMNAKLKCFMSKNQQNIWCLKLLNNKKGKEV
tara:strand:+ start:999 stop:1265 length:267 start_codon:yes stop_codon:yes gene_type:complete